MHRLPLDAFLPLQLQHVAAVHDAGHEQTPTRISLKRPPRCKRVSHLAVSCPCLVKF